MHSSLRKSTNSFVKIEKLAIARIEVSTLATKIFRNIPLPSKIFGTHMCFGIPVRWSEANAKLWIRFGWSAFQTGFRRQTPLWKQVKVSIDLFVTVSRRNSRTSMSSRDRCLSRLGPLASMGKSKRFSFCGQWQFAVGTVAGIDIWASHAKRFTNKWRDELIKSSFIRSPSF